MKSISKTIAIVTTVLGCGFSANHAQALIVTNGCANTNTSCTLQELASGASIAVDGQQFDNWLVDDASTQSIDLSRIAVAGLDDQQNRSGLRYIAGISLSAVGSDLIDLDLRFRVTAMSGSVAITGASLMIDQLTFSPDNVAGFIGVSEDLLESNGVDLIGEQTVFADEFAGSMSLSDSLTFPHRSTMAVATNILVTGGADADAASLDRFTQRFIVAKVPEPPTTVLLMVGLAALLLPRCRRLIEPDLR